MSQHSEINTITLPPAVIGLTLKVTNSEHKKAIRVEGVAVSPGETAFCAGAPIDREHPERGSHWEIRVDDQSGSD